MTGAWRGLKHGSALGHYVVDGVTLCGRWKGLTARNSYRLRKLRPELQREIERFDRCRSCQKKAPTP